MTIGDGNSTGDHFLVQFSNIVLRRILESITNYMNGFCLSKTVDSPCGLDLNGRIETRFHEIHTGSGGESNANVAGTHGDNKDSRSRSRRLKAPNAFISIFGASRTTELEDLKDSVLESIDDFTMRIARLREYNCPKVWLLQTKCVKVIGKQCDFALTAISCRKPQSFGDCERLFSSGPPIL